MGAQDQFAGYLVTDDRGAQLSLLPSASDERLTASRAAAIRQAYETLDANSARNRNITWKEALVVFGAIAAFIASIATGISPMLVAIVMIVGISVYAGSHAKRQAQRALSENQERFVSMLCGQGLCPCCLYDLTGCIPAADNCVECPECGGAWGAKRVRAPTGTIPVPAAAVTSTSVLGQYLRAILRPRSHTFLNDDRGKRVRLAGVGPDELGAVARDEEHLKRIRCVWRSIRRLGRIRRWLCVLFAGSFLVLVIAHFASMFLRARMVSVPWSLIWVLFWIPMVIRLARGVTFAKPESIRRLALEQWVCPSCFSDVTDRSAEEDGCCTCEVCAAAWRRPVKSESPYVSSGAPDAGHS